MGLSFPPKADTALCIARREKRPKPEVPRPGLQIRKPDLRCLLEVDNTRHVFVYDEHLNIADPGGNIWAPYESFFKLWELSF